MRSFQTLVVAVPVVVAFCGPRVEGFCSPALWPKSSLPQRQTWLPSSSTATTATTASTRRHYKQTRLRVVDVRSSSEVPQTRSSSSNSNSDATTSRPQETSTLVHIDDIHNYQDLVRQDDADEAAAAYKKGFAIISLITLFNASLSPLWHTVYQGNGPPPLFLNAVISLVAFGGLLAGAPFMTQDASSRTASSTTTTTSIDPDGAIVQEDEEVTPKKWSAKSFRGGMELGLWKGLGTTCHVVGMALTTANHGAFLLQLTTLIVPVLQGLRGAEQIPRKVQLAIGLALTGIVLFAQDPTKASDIVGGNAAMVQTGDLLVLGAAFFYSLYDIQTYYWGREVPTDELVTIKVGFQTILAIGLCAVAAHTETMEYLSAGPDWNILIPTVLWSGLIVNALATFLQVGGMQGVGPTRAQTIFASQPLWAAGMNYGLLGSVLGLQGMVGGGAFVGALLLAATADAPTTSTDTDKSPALVMMAAEKEE